MKALLFSPVILHRSGGNYEPVEINTFKELCEVLEADHNLPSEYLEYDMVPPNALERLQWLSEPHKLNLEGELMFVHSKKGRENTYAQDVLRTYRSYSNKFYGSSQRKPLIMGNCVVLRKDHWLHLLVTEISKESSK